MHKNIIGLTLIGTLLYLAFKPMILIATKDVRWGMSLIPVIFLALLGSILSLWRPLYAAGLLLLSGALTILEYLLFYFTLLPNHSSIGDLVLGFIVILILMAPGLLFIYAGQFSYHLHKGK